MKSYTDIEQSKVLSKILPPESADLWRNESKNYPEFIKTYHEYLSVSIPPIPCWSLAALISVLPLEIDTHKQTDGDKIYYYVESYMKRAGKETYLSTERHENLIDACYEMTLKLNEQKLL